jgi:hypothetical protein
MTDTIDRISQKVSFDTYGIIWLTDTPLELDTQGVYEVNYLFNGLLVQALENHSQKKKSNFFISQSFGHPFFLSHATSDIQNLNKVIVEHINLVSDSIKENSTVYFIDLTQSNKSNDLIQNLSKKYPKLVFDHLSL